MLVGDMLALGSKNGGKQIVDGRNELFWTEKFILLAGGSLGAYRRSANDDHMTSARKRTFAVQNDMSAMGHKATSGWRSSWLCHRYSIAIRVPTSPFKRRLR